MLLVPGDSVWALVGIIRLVSFWMAAAAGLMPLQVWSSCLIMGHGVVMLRLLPRALMLWQGPWVLLPQAVKVLWEALVLLVLWQGTLRLLPRALRLQPIALRLLPRALRRLPIALRLLPIALRLLRQVLGQRIGPSMLCLASGKVWHCLALVQPLFMVGQLSRILLMPSVPDNSCRSSCRIGIRAHLI